MGGYEAHSPGTWQLAVAATIVLAVRRTLVACSRPVLGDGHHPVVRALGELLACPPAGRVALIAVAAPVWGARVTLLALLDWGIVATCYALAGRGPYRAAARAGTRSRCRCPRPCPRPAADHPRRPGRRRPRPHPADPTAGWTRRWTS